MHASMLLEHMCCDRVAGRVLLPLVVSLFASSSISAQSLSAQEIFTKVSGSVWGVTTFDQDNRRLASGSAVAFADKKVVTNCHVLAKAKSVSVQKQNVSYGAKLLHADPDRDLCILAIDNFVAQAVEILPLAKVQPGAKAYAIGNPRGFELTISEGLVSSIRRDEDGGVRAVQTTAPISPGSSGGGLFDDTGKLIGITTSAREDGQNLNFAMPAEWINEVPGRAEALLAKRDTRNRREALSKNATLRNFAGDDNPAAGDEYVYELRDLLTSKTRPVVYKVTQKEAEGTHFENGYFEASLGSLIRVDNMAHHLYEEMAPVGGWIPQIPVAGASWQVNYSPRNTSLRAATFRATVSGPVHVSTPFGSEETMLISYSGMGTGDSTTGTATSSSYQFTASVWWSPRLKRVVQFESERRFDTFRRSFEKERLTLVSMRRLFD
jgi:serine protease Do